MNFYSSEFLIYFLLILFLFFCFLLFETATSTSASEISIVNNSKNDQIASQINNNLKNHNCDASLDSDPDQNHVTEVV